MKKTLTKYFGALRAQFSNVEIHYNKFSSRARRFNDNAYITTLYPEKRIYFHRNPDPDKRQPHSELDIYSTMSKDIYSIFSSYDAQKNEAYFKIMINQTTIFITFKTTQNSSDAHTKKAHKNHSKTTHRNFTVCKPIGCGKCD